MLVEEGRRPEDGPPDASEGIGDRTTACVLLAGWVAAVLLQSLGAIVFLPGVRGRSLDGFFAASDASWNLVHLWIATGVYLSAASSNSVTVRRLGAGAAILSLTRGALGLLTGHPMRGLSHRWITPSFLAGILQVRKTVYFLAMAVYLIWACLELRSRGGTASEWRRPPCSSRSTPVPGSEASTCSPPRAWSGSSG